MPIAALVPRPPLGADALSADVAGVAAALDRVGVATPLQRSPTALSVDGVCAGRGAAWWTACATAWRWRGAVEEVNTGWPLGVDETPAVPPLTRSRRAAGPKVADPPEATVEGELTAGAGAVVAGCGVRLAAGRCGAPARPEPWEAATGVAPLVVAETVTAPAGAEELGLGVGLGVTAPVLPAAAVPEEAVPVPAGGGAGGAEGVP